MLKAREILVADDKDRMQGNNMEVILPEVGFSKKKKRCPKCGSRETVRIVYGFPAPELVEEAQRGKVELGGCCMTPDQPERRCKSCGYSWRAEEQH